MNFFANTPINNKVKNILWCFNTELGSLQMLLYLMNVIRMIYSIEIASLWIGGDGTRLRMLPTARHCFQLIKIFDSKGYQIFLGTTYQNAGKNNMRTKLSQNTPIFSILRPTKIYLNWDFWYEDIQSDNPVWFNFIAKYFYRTCAKCCFFVMRHLIGTVSSFNLVWRTT
jgi:hypothetical protein